MNRIYIIMSLVAISAIPMFYFIPYLNEKYADPYLFGGLIVVEVFLFLIGNYIETKRHMEDKKEKHTQSLNEKIFTKLVDVQPRIDRHHKLSFQIPTDYHKYQAMKNDLFMFEDEEMIFEHISRLPQPALDWAFEHIKSYNNLNKSWKNSCSLVVDYNNLVTKIKQQSLKDVIVKEIDARFTGFKPFNPGDKLSNEDIYDLSHIIHLMYETFEDYDGIGTIPTFEELTIEPDEDRYYATIRTRNIRIVQSSREIAIDEVRDLLLAIYCNQNLLQQFHKLKEIHEQAKGEIREFDNNLEVLVSEINEGALIQGKCKLGY